MRKNSNFAHDRLIDLIPYKDYKEVLMSNNLLMAKHAGKNANYNFDNKSPFLNR
jgi:hypothetical protein